MNRFSLIIALVFLLLFSSCKWNTRKKNSSISGKEAPETYIAKLDSVFIENSGIIYWKKMLWTFNDSGGKNEIYGLNIKTGHLEITLRLTNATNLDWEDIAQNDRYIFIAETGNNDGRRTDLHLLRIEKNLIGNEPFQNIKAEKIYFNFADQRDFNPLFRHNSYDCEALFECNDSLFVFTKDWLNHITKAYAMPNVPGNYSLMPIDSFNVEGLVTGVDINSRGKIALLGYQDFKSFVWIFNKNGKNLFNDPKFIDLGMLQNAQTEGICFNPKGDLLISCEQTTNYLQQVWRIRKRDFR
ncbi:MAG: hypothetical protein ACERKD_22645 [Prolixibacteraceae bacterium]